MAELSPMLKQYLEIKQQNPDALLFFRLGDFYEMFFEDAKIASEELELTLTGRDCGLEERAPMCGVPFHSYEGYVAKLVQKGYKVAICEQLEDPALAKGLVKRDIIRIITPGTVIESSMLDETRNNFLAALFFDGDGAGLCFADVSTGETRVTELVGENIPERVREELSRFSPSELLISPLALSLDGLEQFLKERMHTSVELLGDEAFSLTHAAENLTQQLGAETVQRIDFDAKQRVAAALSALMDYIKDKQRSGSARIGDVEYYIGSQYMKLDASAKRNLELCETMRNKERKGSLLWVLDKTKTAMGKRLIRKWIEQPLVNPAHIQLRLNAVDELVESEMLRDELVDALSGVSDLERLMTRVVYGSVNPRELRALAYTASRLPAVKGCLMDCSCRLISSLRDDIDTIDDVRDLIERAIIEDPPLLVREGGIIKPGFNEEIDTLRSDRDGGKGFITRLENAERERTGITKLKVGFNRVFGYYIEVSNSFKDKIPADYIRKQTLANCERYITQELKDMESRVLGAQDRLVKLEYQLFEQVRKSIAESLERIRRTAQSIASLDVLCSFANVSVSRRYVRPLVNTSGKIALTESRHPVVEALVSVPFVPNDVYLDNADNRVAIITGPNMAGKSTYMRQTALIVLMAQIGCFVPCQQAEIGVVDGIYTRVGASDDLSTGQSTFMVEMTEVADILKNATADSLLILDEIGRGTSTFDGMSIARAVLEYVASKRRLGAKALFATHYHELTAVENTVKCVKNYNIAAKKHGDDVIFLRRIIRGGADDSYGIEVAKLAGVPDWCIKRAKVILAQLESGNIEQVDNNRIEQSVLSVTPPGEQEAVFRLKNLDVNSLSPMAALNILNDLCSLVK